MEISEHSFVVFPYLKTLASFELGGLIFRSTDKLDGLAATDSKMVSEITAMLFLQNSVRIRSGTFALLPRLPDYQENESDHLDRVKAIQSVLAYCYAAPHSSFGYIFLPLESSDVLTITPDRVSDFLVWSEHHTIDVEPQKSAPFAGKPEMRMRSGYRGYRNFKLPFWVTEGCRLYPSIPTLPLNISQDLSHDVREFNASAMYSGLFNLLESEASEFRNRILTAISWFNRTISSTTDEPTAIIQLAIAFEALLQLPSADKTDRFVDAISLLLGRVPRLDVWASQFYKLRSQIAHEGKALHTRFVVPSTKGKSSEDSLYHSILVFGRQIFQACLSAILFGDHLAKRTDLGAKLFTNAERFLTICKLLSDGSVTPLERLRSARTPILDLDKYRYVSETGLEIDRLLGAVKLASQCLLNSNETLVKFRSEDLKEAVESKDNLATLDALQKLNERGPRKAFEGASEVEITGEVLFDVVWHYTFQHYFWSKREQEKGDEDTPIPRT